MDMIEERIPVVCTTCDPPSTVYVLKGTPISKPYICTCCEQRALKRIQRRENPFFGRMNHGKTRFN